ncbi:glutamine synthetase family protein [Amycolatopsis sp. CB00013]|uniref:glutamine synthetase family protein n=1 Tax=Amycolatopsis sp. CB00013 TaxID=1703945 RepID=UPI00093C9B82|nr:glutamine synthetase family protein [Amycolatopsis sp. CB00013]OKJ91187.1 glutamine synthetase [Amycolatopsis sp. CB00013]
MVNREALTARATALTGELRARGVELVALTFVDNAGIARVKAVPLRKLPSAAAWGVGASNSFDFFGFDDVITGGEHSLGPVGDLRLHPDLDALTVLAGQPGWAWAPVTKLDQEGEPHPQDGRALLATAVDRLAARGHRARMSFEIEWVITSADAPDDAKSATAGPAYGYARLSERADYLRALVSTLDQQGVGVEQIHPEYADGQFELSVAAADPVRAADIAVLTKETIRALSHRHGLKASFTPKFAPAGVGNGGHVHLSVWDGARNLFSGGERVFGLTPLAESFSAGILKRLPALLAIGAPSVVSYLRLEPHHWAGVYTAWGLENRETPLRLVRGVAGNRASAANLEVKCFDLTANPYLLAAALLFAGMAGADEEASLPEPLDVDPGILTEEERAARGVERLPQRLEDAVAAFEADKDLAAAFGAPLATTIVDVRRAEIERFADASPEEITEAQRWRH